MSRIGKMPIAVPAGVTVTIAENNKATVKGPKGTLERELAPELTIEEKDGRPYAMGFDAAMNYGYLMAETVKAEI